ncbi:PAS domain S-box protein [Fusibacter sp. 3D3]|uniref:PAS domain S-box protein n=1 Tax=Fusibacter sp. 3D3 TaxID=1048380 RepID=UPI000853C65F|nr:PAS domain S-box protein [Fusibacter sp. 3D3]GAU79411.1 sensory box histidine kinase/response regulator [Fusibacter sp. 3D3]
MVYVIVGAKIILEIVIFYKLILNNSKNRGDRYYFIYILLFLMLIFDIKILVSRDTSLLVLNQLYVMSILFYALFYFSKSKLSVRSIVSSFMETQELAHSEIINHIDEAVAVIKKDNLDIVSYNALFNELIIENQHFINLEDIISSVKRGENAFEIKDYNNVKLNIRVRLLDYGTKYVVIYVKDISELAMIRTDLRRQHQSFQEMWETAPYVVIIRELFGRIVYINKKAEYFFDKKAKEVEGQSFYTLFSDGVAPKWHVELERELLNNEKGAVTRTESLINRHNEKKFFQIEEKIVHYQRNNHICSMLYDLTELYYERLKSQAFNIIYRNNESIRQSNYIIVDLINDDLLYGDALELKLGKPIKKWHAFFDLLDLEAQVLIKNILKQPESFSTERIHFTEGQQFIIEDYIISDPHNVTGFILSYVDLSAIHYSPEIVGRNVLNHIREGIIIINFEGKIEYSNDAICRILGFEDQELLTKNIVEITKALTLEMVKANWEVTRTHKSHKFDRIYIHKNGLEIPVEITGKHIEIEDSEKLILVIRDMSEKLIYKRRFADSQLKFTQLFDAIQDGIFEIKLPNMNVNFYKQFDMERGFIGIEISYLQWINNIYEEDRSIVYESIDILTAEKKDEVQFEYRYQNGSEWEWMRARGRYLEDQEGASILLINRNISEIKTIALKLEESKYILTESEKISHMAHWRYDVSRSVFDVSETFDEMFRIKDIGNEITFEQFLEIVHPSDRNYFEAKFTRSIWASESLDVIFRITNATHIRYIQLFGKTYYSPNQTPIYIIGNTVDITEKMIAARRLEDSKKLLEGIIDQSPTGIIVTKRNGRIEVINEEATKLLNVHEDFEMTFDKISQLITERYETDADGSIQELLRTIQNGHTINAIIKGNKQNSKRQNSNQWLMLYASPMHDEEGRFTGNIIIIIDISERTLMQAQLLEQTSKLLNAEKLAKLGHFEFNDNFDKLFASEVIYDILEIEPLIPFNLETLMAMVAEEDYERIFTILEVVKGHTGHYTLEFKLITVYGKVKHVQIILIKSIKNNKTYYEGTIQDVSVINSVMERIRQSEREKDTLISSISDQITYYNTKREIVTLNHTKYKHIIGKDEKIIGKLCESVFGPKGDECEVCIVQKTLDTHKPLSREYYQDHQWYEQKTHPVFDDQNKIVGVVEIIRDITQEKFIRDKQTSLDKIQVYDQVSKGIALDYNNKLMGIVGYLNLINDFKTLPKTVREYIEIISKTALTLQETTEHLLVMSNSKIAKQSVIDLAKSVDSAIKFINHMYDINTKLITDFPDENICVMGNEDMLFNMIVSLLLNAIDATETIDNPVIQVVIKQDLTTHLAYIKIIDNGIGIPDILKDRLFEPFFTTKSDASKSGMGLTTVKSIVKEMNGQIDFTSKQGLTEFCITFKIVEGASQKLVLNENVYKENNRNGILIIDDEEIVRMLFVNVLSDQGYLIFEASNAFDGMALYEENQAHIELVIMDMVMPEMSGRQTFEALKNLDPNIKIIITTGYSNDDDVHYVLENGALDLLKKPVSIASIKKRVAQFFSHEVALEQLDEMKHVIDVKEALRKLEGNEKLYERICKKFYIKYNALPLQIEEDMAADNWQGIRNSAHNIKGLAGNIGDKRLETVCFDLELSIRNDVHDTQLVETFINALKLLLSYLETSIDMTEDSEF